MKTTALILAAGKGKRMGGKIPKQYMELEGYPIIYYTIEVFQKRFIDEIIMVVGEGEKRYCEKEIVKKYGFNKVKKIVEGGKERYHSVYNGLKAIEKGGYVYIHDGARPFITEEILWNIQKEVEKNKACIVGVPVKDTIKLVSRENIVIDTPERKKLWQIQTPQVFEYSIIMEAYKKIIKEEDSTMTDDAMVVEKMLGYPIKVVEGSYGNIKITTPDDIFVAKELMKSQGRE